MSPDPAARRVSRRTTLIVLAAAVLVAVVVVVTSPLFDVRRIAVHGNRRLSSGQVGRLSGIPLGANLILLSTAEVERRLLASPWIASASTSRRLPGTLVLTVGERRAVAQVPDGGKGVAVVAADGVIVERRDRPAADVVLLERVRTTLSVGSRLRDRVPSVRVAASLDARVSRQVQEIHERAGHVELILSRGGVVRYGRPESMPQKNAAIRAMLRYARRQGLEVEYLDVRAPTSPVLKPAGAPAVQPGVEG